MGFTWKNLALCVALTVWVSPAGAGTLYVDDDAPPGGNGGSWETAFTFLQDALTAAVSGDEIRVAQGTYYPDRDAAHPTGTSDRAASFTLKDGVAIFGGYAGLGTTAPDERDVASYDTVLSGDIGMPSSNIDNSYHVVHAGSTGPTALLDGVTITAGNNDGSYPYGGGGVYCVSSSPTLTNCTITRNGAYADGGGVCCESSSNPTLISCTITYNSASSGGGVCCTSSSNPALSNCTIAGNWASFGGGVYCNVYASPMLSECTVTDNYALSLGGGAFCGADATLANCRIVGNAAASSGGGMYCSGGDPMLTNCTVARNSAHAGGGVSCVGYCTAMLTNCTITTNAAGGDAGGMYCYDAASPTLTNCIVWENTPQAIFVEAANPIVTYSDVQGGWTGTGNIDADPGFAFPDDPHLLSSSPCVDAGTNSPPGGLPPADSDGQPSPLDGDGDGAAVADMGAYEFNPATPILTLTATKLTFTVAFGHIESQTLGIRNSSFGTLPWELEWNTDWLMVDPPAGESTGELDTVTLTVDTANLAHGTYVTTIWVDSDQAFNAPRPVTVIVRVTLALHVPSEYATIQAAMDATTVPGDEVVIADGVYTGAGNKDLDFRGRAITVRSASGDPATCIIDCEGSGRGLYFHTYESAASIVQGLTIRNGNAGHGGGVYCHYASCPTLTDCTIADNVADYGGGAYCTYFSNPTLIHCAITGNYADYGGALYGYDVAKPMLTNCTIVGNAADRNGGGVYCAHRAHPALTDCTIAANAANAYGGGMHCDYYASPTLTNCAIIGNSAAEGGGVCCTGSSSPRLTNCTITGNSAYDGVGLYGYGPCNPILANCVLWTNPPVAIFVNSGNAIVTYCDVQGGYDGTGNIDADPLFVRNPSPGSDGQWGTPDDDYGDLRLTHASVCIDAGDNAAVPADVTADMDGASRFVDVVCRPDTGSGTPPIVDMGAYEAPGDVFIDCNENGVDDLCDVLDGTSRDANGNGVPDECEVCVGDLDCSGVIDFGDINAFVLYLSNLPVWQLSYAGCDAANGDIDGDGVYPSFGDINPFVTLLSTHALPIDCP